MSKYINGTPLGSIHSKIVGVRYYDGYASTGERVIPRREPGNPYDRNAIKVLNVMGTQIGHLPREMAAKLAKYMVKRIQMSNCIAVPKGLTIY